MFSLILILHWKIIHSLFQCFIIRLKMYIANHFIYIFTKIINHNHCLTLFFSSSFPVSPRSVSLVHTVTLPLSQSSRYAPRHLDLSHIPHIFCLPSVYNYEFSSFPILISLPFSTVLSFTSLAFFVTLASWFALSVLDH